MSVKNVRLILSMINEEHVFKLRNDVIAYELIKNEQEPTTECIDKVSAQCNINRYQRIVQNVR